MPGLVPGIHVFLRFGREDVDGRDKPGHDDVVIFVSLFMFR
jgi:hydroxymethylglutaryl-CoA lyase